MNRLCEVTTWESVIPYQPVWDQMKAWTQARVEATPDQLWLMRHQPVYTQGLAGRPEHILNAHDVPIVQTDRGGQVTYHGPGQLMVYTLFNIDRLGLSTRDFVRALESVVIGVLTRYNITSKGRADAPGVYVGDKKICSIGLRIRRGCAYHGLALNAHRDLGPFQGINPCGYRELEMTCIEDWSPVSLSILRQQVIEEVHRIFGFSSFSVVEKNDWMTDDSEDNE